MHSPCGSGSLNSLGSNPRGIDFWPEPHWSLEVRTAWKECEKGLRADCTTCPCRFETLCPKVEKIIDDRTTTALKNAPKPVLCEYSYWKAERDRWEKEVGL